MSLRDLRPYLLAILMTLPGLLLLRHWRLVAELRYGFHVKVRDIVHH